MPVLTLGDVFIMFLHVTVFTVINSIHVFIYIYIFVDSHCTLGESPVYDSRNNILYFVDINENAVHSVEYLESGRAGTHKVYSLDKPVGCVFLTTDVGRVGVAVV